MRGRTDVHVLHVDDEPDLANLTAEMLEREDERFNVETATSATQGLDKLNDAEYDCIVSDYDMPGQNGIEFLHTIREDYPDLPFILYTGKGSEEVASEAISAGVTDYLQKESGMDQYTILSNRIQNAVEGKRAKHERAEIRERMELALRETNSVTFEIDLDTGEVARQGAVEQFFDLPTEAMSTKTQFAENAVHPEDRTRFRTFFQQLRESDQEYDVFDFRTNEESGDVRWIRSHAHHIISNGNEQIIGLAQDISEQKKREQTLRQRERRYRAMFNDPNILTGVLDKDGTLIEANQQALDYIDAPKEEVIGNLIWETPWWDAEIRPVVRRKVEQAAGGAYTNYEADLTKPNGEPYSVTGQIRPVTDDSGDVRSLIISARDITERTERERELQRYEAYLEESTDIITVLDETGTITYQSPAVKRILGYEVEQLIGQNGFDYIHPDDVDDIYDAFTDLVANPGSQVTVECRFGTADDEWRWLEVKGTNRLEHDAINGIVTNNRDITQRKERDQELQETSRQLQAVLDTVEAALFIKDTEGRYQLMNEECRRLLGVGPNEDVTGLTDHDLLPEDVAVQYREADRRVMEAGETLAIEEEIPMPDGPQLNRTLKSPFYDEDGDLQGVCAVSTDITEWKEQERTLKQERDRLNKFASVVSHDIQNPLSVAIGRLELVREECDSDHLAGIETALERIDRITDDVLWLAREGQDIGSLNEVRLQDAINSAWKLVANSSEQAELRFDCGGHSTETIEADDDRLSQLLENLLRNAIDHGGKDVTVTVGMVDDGFYVEDDGPGIPEDRREDVFTSGYSTGETGTGFGLSIVKEVAEAHNWEISIGEGTDGGARVEITGLEILGK